MRLFGTVTSPFVRRVRVVALELGVDLELVSTASPEGQEALARVTPLRKVPVLELASGPLFDSHAICERLLAEHGPGPLRPRRAESVRESNTIHAIDGALESAIRLFYFHRDHVDVESIPYMRTERERVGRTLEWLEEQVRGAWCTEQDGFGLAELAVATTIEWMQFRAIAALEAYPRLLALTAVHASRASMVATRPG